MVLVLVLPLQQPARTGDPEDLRRARAPVVPIRGTPPRHVVTLRPHRVGPYRLTLVVTPRGSRAVPRWKCDRRRSLQLQRCGGGGGRCVFEIKRRPSASSCVPRARRVPRRFSFRFGPRRDPPSLSVRPDFVGRTLAVRRKSGTNEV